jgi:hypothetical protein
MEVDGIKQIADMLESKKKARAKVE